MVWNVENFTTDDSIRTGKIADTIYENSPDVFGLLEFQARDSARSLVLNYFSDYSFAFTYSKTGMEILVGWKKDKFEQVIYSQRRDFAASIHLRPGGLLSLRQKGESEFYSLLFLHLDSGTKSKDYANRQKMYEKIWNLNKTLKRLPVQEKGPRLIALGDFNTMGKKGVTLEQELESLSASAKKNGMRVLPKSHDSTWKGNGRYPDADLDHVIASSGIKFKVTDGWNIKVDGWNNMCSEKQQRDYAKNVSDHSPLIGNVISDSVK